VGAVALLLARELLSKAMILPIACEAARRDPTSLSAGNAALNGVCMHSGGETVHVPQ